jgi:hypothetical protein
MVTPQSPNGVPRGMILYHDSSSGFPVSCLVKASYMISRIAPRVPSYLLNAGARSRSFTKHISYGLRRRSLIQFTRWLSRSKCRCLMARTTNNLLASSSTMSSFKVMVKPSPWLIPCQSCLLYPLYEVGNHLLTRCCPLGRKFKSSSFKERHPAT